MKTSDKGRAFIAREEGCKLYGYKDSVGVWTIGIGHANTSGQPPTVSAGLRLTLQQCLDLFAKDLGAYERRVEKAFTVPLTQAQFDAAVSFDYNTGAIDKASWVKQFNKNRAPMAAGAAMMAWDKPAEIIGRRTREKRLFEAGAYGDLSGMTVWTAPGAKPVKMAFPTSLQPDDPGPVIRDPLDPAPVPPKVVKVPKPEVIVTGLAALIAWFADNIGVFVGLAALGVAGVIAWRFRDAIKQKLGFAT